MKILHSYCLNYNVGDYALGIGMKNLLRNYLDVDFIGNTNIQGRYFDEYYINEVVNKKYDLLVIGGGGIIHGAHWPNGWFWLINQDLIKDIKIPFIVYGVGNNYFEGEIIPNKAVLHLQETFKYAKSFSVRNDGSYERLVEQVGILPVEVPDPGFYVGLNTSYHRIIDGDYVIIQVANDKVGQRFGAENTQKNFVVSMRNIARELSQKYRVIFAPHVYEDIFLSREIMEGLDNCGIWNFGDIAFDHTEVAISYYRHAKLVISMRGHGQIVPLSFNIPVIALSNHPKHKGLMKKLGLSEYCVDVSKPNFDVEVMSLVDLIEVSARMLHEQIGVINKIMLEQTDKAFSDIKILL